MSETLCPEWLPNWRDSSKYPDPESTSGKQWAWEFLRRNKEYQAEWKERDEADYSVICGPKGSGVSRSNEYAPFHKQVCMMLLGQRWGLACNAPDPSVTAPEILLFQQDFMVGAMTYEDVETYGRMPLVPSDWPVAYLTFNLELPLDPQLKDARRYLTETKKRFRHEGKIGLPDKLHRTPDGSILLNYLRCSDANAEKVTNSKIAQVVFPLLKNDFPEWSGNNRVADYLGAASKLIESNYRYLSNELTRK